MSNPAVLRMVDAVTVPVPDIDQGLEFYRATSATSCCGATTKWGKLACAYLRAEPSSCSAPACSTSPTG